MGWETASHVSTTFGNPALIVVALFAAQVARRQLSSLRAVEESKFAIELKRLFHEFEIWHIRLLPDKRRIVSLKRFENRDMALLYGYLGAFEVLYRAIQNGTISLDFAQRQFKYRLQNVVANKEILALIFSQKSFWQDLLCLCELWSISLDSALIGGKTNTGSSAGSLYRRKSAESKTLP